MIDVKNVHICLIGGIGTSAAAKYFLARGAKVTGSNINDTESLVELRELGIDVTLNQVAENITDSTELLIYSLAAPVDNPERVEARRRGIPELSYPQFLGELSRRYKTISISGTNGKSTTTAMLAKIMIAAGYDPVVFLGTYSADLEQRNFRYGNGVWLLAETCEYKEGMLNSTPHIAVITNIEADHLDYYRDVDHIRSSFEKWLNGVKKFDGYVILNATDFQSQKVERSDAWRFSEKNRRADHGIQSFSVEVSGDRALKLPVQLKVPGEFNAQNAAAAVAAAKAAGINDAVIKAALAEFAGTWRRFEHLGEWLGTDTYSDYAHHPTAIRGTIAAAKEHFPGRRLVIVFEPHQHARTKELFPDFVEAFNEADVSILSEIYRVEGRTEDEHISSQDIVAAALAKRPAQNISYATGYDDLKVKLPTTILKNDIVIFMGAGTIDAFAREIIK